MDPTSRIALRGPFEGIGRESSTGTFSKGSNAAAAERLREWPAFLIQRDNRSR